jgi:predicted dehydrogenase
MRSVCIVGCGRMGVHHARSLRGRVNLYFYNRTTSKAKKLNKNLSGRGIFESYVDILEDDRIDAVVLTSPPNVHKDQVISALKSDKSVLVEKPMCISSEELKAIGHVVNTSNRPFLMVAENYYYKPLYTKIRKVIQRGDIGNLKKIVVRKHRKQKVTDWRKNYGALIEGGIHFVALISDLIGDHEPTSVKINYPNKKHNTPERTSITHIQYPGGETAELYYSWEESSLTQGLFQHSIIYGSHGKIILESNGLYAWVSAGKKTRLRMCSLKDIAGFNTMIDDFVRCLEEGNRRPYSDYERAKRDLSIIFLKYP